MLLSRPITCSQWLTQILQRKSRNALLGSLAAAIVTTTAGILSYPKSRRRRLQSGPNSWNGLMQNLNLRFPQGPSPDPDLRDGVAPSTAFWGDYIATLPDDHVLSKIAAHDHQTEWSAETAQEAGQFLEYLDQADLSQVNETFREIRQTDLTVYDQTPQNPFHRLRESFNGAESQHSQARDEVQNIFESGWESYLEHNEVCFSADPEDNDTYIEHVSGPLNHAAEVNEDLPPPEEETETFFGVDAEGNLVDLAEATSLTAEVEIIEPGNIESHLPVTFLQDDAARQLVVTDEVHVSIPVTRTLEVADARIPVADPDLHPDGTESPPALVLDEILVNPPETQLGDFGGTPSGDNVIDPSFGWIIGWIILCLMCCVSCCRLYVLFKARKRRKQDEYQLVPSPDDSLLSSSSDDFDDSITMSWQEKQQQRRRLLDPTMINQIGMMELAVGTAIQILMIAVGYQVFKSCTKHSRKSRAIPQE